MFVQEIERAVLAAPRVMLLELSSTLWKGHAAGVIGDDDAQRIAELIEARKSPALQPNGALALKRRTGSRPRSPASVERRRAWAASSWLPPRIASSFTQAEQAALGVILSTIAISGSCELCHAAVAGRSGTSVSTVKRALSEARQLGLIMVEERRLTWARNLPNVITVLSPELQTWVATRGRGLRAAKGMWEKGGGVQVRTTPESIFNIPLSNPSVLARDRAWRGQERVDSDKAKPRRPIIEKSMARPMRGSWSDMNRHQVK